MGCTENPARRAPGWRARMRSIIAAAAAPTSSGGRLSATPPTSLLWEMSGDTIFSATLPPSVRAAAAASAGSRAVRVRLVGMPQAASTALAWGSPSMPPPPSTTGRMISLARVTSMAICSGAETGVSISASRLRWKLTR